MSPYNKQFRVLDKFVSRLKEKIEVDGTYKFRRKQGLKSAQKIIAFFKKHGRWPNRTSESVRERKLGQRYENMCSKESAQYNKDFRRIALALGRTTNRKRKHNVQGFKQEILAFVQANGRAPTTHAKADENECRLRGKLDYYTKACNDMTLLGKVYEVDKCHKSGIPMKFRATINEALQDAPKPLIRTVS